MILKVYKYSYSFFLFVLLLVSASLVFAQEKRVVTVSGLVVDNFGAPVSAATVQLKNTSYGASTNVLGQFDFKAPIGSYTLTVSYPGFARYETQLQVSESVGVLKIAMTAIDLKLKEAEVRGKTAVKQLKETGFSVEAIEMKDMQSQTIQINRLLDHSAGVKVRQQAGIGSDFNYSLNGLSGNAIKFFVDGVPLEYFGSSYGINNLPVSLIDRLEVYKGVVPADFGGDALGGAINVVTKKTNNNFIESSYSFGSFNTHQAVLNGQYVAKKSKFTARLASFYTYADNNYKIWGRGVNYADESTGFKAVEFTKENPAVRFNDQFRTLNGKVDIGFVNTRWADQFFVSLLASDQKKGIQTGQTMATVYGKLHYTETVLMPHMNYQKKNLLVNGLDVNVFAGYTKLEGATVDTAMSFYNWKNETIPHQQGGGEIARNGQSLFTMFEDSWIGRANVSYRLPSNFKFGFNYFMASAKRTGEDPYMSSFRVPFVAPQETKREFAGVFFETRKLQDRLYLNAFGKWYGFNTSSNKLDYVLVNGDYQSTAVPIANRQQNWGGGIASSFKFGRRLLAKFSVEQATRLPSPTEALGNGILVTNNPNLKPEQSLNINVGATVGRLHLGGQHGLTFGTSLFYRDTKNQLLYELTSKDAGQYVNVGKVLGKGVEVETQYDFDSWLKANINFTYMDLRNNQATENGVANIVYRDRLRNTPYLLANAGISAKRENVIQAKSTLFAYLHANYLHKFYLRWPSLGNQETKDMIPSQTVFDFGVGYSFPNKRISLAIDLNNFTNTQAYDNFLLQKPGRAAFVKLSYYLNNI